MVSEVTVPEVIVRKVRIRILNPKIGDEIPLPSYATDGSAAMDLRACLDGPIQLAPGECRLIPTGIAAFIEDPGMAGMVLPRSGLGMREGIVLGNLVGLIDSDYQGELGVPCWNRSDQARTIQSGDRIAQLMLIPVARFAWEVVQEFPASDRGVGGFGHTGRN